MRHEIVRVRHELVRRDLEVLGVENVTPNMLRLTLGGDSLATLTTLAPDDHVKVVVGEGATEVRREYTVRALDAARRLLTLEFALHDAGPVTDWARSARVGDHIVVAGPRGSGVVPDDFDWWLLIGDETGIPAIARRLEELSAGRLVTSIIAVANAREQQTFATRTTLRSHWLHRPLEQADDPTPFLAALADWSPPEGNGFIWIATESNVARALRTHVLEQLRHPLAWMKAAGYWSKGLADTPEKFAAPNAAH
ncbi:MAG: siderophore-interacting protein [Gemmatimonas sp.]